ncbi:MAG: chitobiase/beta-hexosaminidase C-terminal domain-containing protein [Spirochaetia bacterium]|nr:chitobiase/beta-hexosaminidase C-terminal domain-containing protein [Spirochaetia bacterium]
MLLLSGCQDPDPYGELQFGLDEGTSKSITPGSSAKVTQVSFWGEETNSSKTLSKQTLILGEKNTVSSIPVGTWDFHVEGMNSDGTVITEQADATGVAVNSGKTSSISFTLHYLTSDTGTYSIGISWPEDLGASFKGVGADIGEDYVAGTISSSSVAVSGTAAAGDYMVGVRFTNPSGTQITFSGMDMVNVFTGLESSGTISFEDADFSKAAQPTISTGDVTGGKQVTMATDTAEATIYYTTDGTDPATSSTRESYTAPFTLTESKTVEAVAVKADLLDSEEASQAVTVSAAVTPTFSLSSGDTQDVAISCKTSGATIHYRYAVGSASYGSWTTGTSIPVTQGKELKVEAYAEKDGMVRSATGTQAYSVATGPDFSKTTGTYSNTFTLTLTGDTIRYKAGSGTYQTYLSGISIASTGTTITAFNEESGKVNSAAASRTYTLRAAMPEIDGSLSAPGGKAITISSATSGATIYYTTDGSTPSTSSHQYVGAVTVTASVTVRAIAVKDGFADSSTAVLAVTVSQVATPVISPTGGTFEGTQSVTVSCGTDGATIYCTTDDSMPTTLSNIYDGAITLDATVTVRAMAVKSGMADSSVASATYTWKKTYSVGDTGPAGGIIFYDCDADNMLSDPDGADNMESSVCGWRYLEAAPADEGYYVWGGYGTSISGTYREIGDGKANTEAIVAKFGTAEPYEGRTDYAAKVCYDKILNGYSDWFLPSLDELRKMYDQIYTEGGFKKDYYWSSYSSEGDSDRAYFVKFTFGARSCHDKDNCYCVRAVRAF